MVSKARLDFPEPESPVMQIRRFRGRRTVMSFRLCSRAPWTTSSSAAIRAAIVLQRTCVRKALLAATPAKPAWPLIGIASDALVPLRDAVREQAPRGGVPGGREEVPPVLDHEPGAGGSGREGGPAQIPGVGEPAGEERGEHREAEGELVDPQTADEYPGAKPVTLQAKHVARVFGKITFRIKIC